MPSISELQRELHCLSGKYLHQSRAFYAQQQEIERLREFGTSENIRLAQLVERLKAERDQANELAHRALRKQVEPTRDPRLLSAEQLANCKAMYGQHGDVQKLLAHIAAQDQRCAALVEAATRLLGDEDECYEPGKSLVLTEHMLAVRTALAALAQPPGDE